MDEESSRPSVIDRIILKPDGPSPKSLLVMLPGRGMSIEEMLWIGRSFMFDDMMIMGVVPAMGSFYPPPHSPADQDEALAGIGPATDEIGRAVASIVAGFGVPWERTAAFGFSAGGVMSYQLARAVPIRSTFVVAGAILDPSDFGPPADKLSNHLAVHHKHDSIFKWQERHLPTKKALREHGWRCRFIEGPGEHRAYKPEIEQARDFLQACLCPRDVVRIEGKKK